ncbi:MAG: hypothetical protein ACI9HI_001984 [Salinirussus sp.]|jgi:hypothetical protein
MGIFPFLGQFRDALEGSRGTESSIRPSRDSRPSGRQRPVNRGGTTQLRVGPVVVPLVASLVDLLAGHPRRRGGEIYR